MPVSVPCHIFNAERPDSQASWLMHRCFCCKWLVDGGKHELVGISRMYRIHIITTWEIGIICARIAALKAFLLSKPSKPSSNKPKTVNQFTRKKSKNKNVIGFPSLQPLSPISLLSRGAYSVSSGLGVLGDKSTGEDAGTGLLAARGSSAVTVRGGTVAIWGSSADWDRDNRCGAHDDNNRASAATGGLVDAPWVGSST